MRPVGWIVVVEGNKYFVISCSEAAATRKAMIEYKKTVKLGRGLRLTNPERKWRITIWRSHRKEMENQTVLK